MQKSAMALASLAVLTACSEHLCGENSQAVSRAKSLTSPQVETLYRDTMDLIRGYDPERFGRLSTQDPVPKQFAHLAAQAVRVEKDSAWIYLESCGFDDKVVLFVYSNGEILLRWGEGPATGRVKLRSPQPAQ
jgi:hypothetical protein